jgi:hypothetical protein
MSNLRLMSVREIRQAAIGTEGGWIAVEVGEGSWALRCGDVEVCTVNNRTPRRFRSLDAIKQALKEEIGATEFLVTVVEN